MFDRLEAVEQRYEKLNELLMDPDVINDPKKLRDYSKEQADLEETVQTYREYKSVREQLAEAKAMLEEKLEPELREMVKEEIGELEEREEALVEKLKVLLLPKDPNDEKTSLWKSAQPPAAKRRRCLPATCTGCIRAMRNRKGGRRK